MAGGIATLALACVVFLPMLGGSKPKAPGGAPVVEKSPKGGDTGKEPVPIPAKKPDSGKVVLVLQGDPSGTKVFLDGKQLATAGFRDNKSEIEAEEGQYTLMVTQPGYTPYSQQLTVRAGPTQVVQVKLERVDVAVDVPKPLPPPPPVAKIHDLKGHTSPSPKCSNQCRTPHESSAAVRT